MKLFIKVTSFIFLLALFLFLFFGKIYAQDVDFDPSVAICGTSVAFRSYNLDPNNCHEIGIDCSGDTVNGIVPGILVARLSSGQEEITVNKTFNISGICQSGDVAALSGSYVACVQAVDCVTNEIIPDRGHYANRGLLTLIAQPEPVKCDSGYYCTNDNGKICEDQGGIAKSCLSDDGKSTGTCCKLGTPTQPPVGSCASNEYCTIAGQAACEDGLGRYVGANNCGWYEAGGAGRGSCCYPKVKPGGYSEWGCVWTGATNARCVADFNVNSACYMTDLAKFDGFCGKITNSNDCDSYYNYLRGVTWGWCKPPDNVDYCYVCAFDGSCGEVLSDNGLCDNTQYWSAIACEYGCTNYACNTSAWSCYPSPGGPYAPPGIPGRELCKTQCRKCGPLDKDPACDVPAVRMPVFCDSSGKITKNPNLTGRIFSGIGCIPVKTDSDFVKFLLQWGLGLGGGIAFLLIIYAGFLIISSGGNPQRLKAGKELLAAAMMGIVMLTFSIYVLKIIGIDIFSIPGLI